MFIVATVNQLFLKELPSSTYTGASASENVLSISLRTADRTSRTPAYPESMVPWRDYVIDIIWSMCTCDLSSIVKEHACSRVLSTETTALIQYSLRISVTLNMFLFFSLYSLCAHKVMLGLCSVTVRVVYSLSSWELYEKVDWTLISMRYTVYEGTTRSWLT